MIRQWEYCALVSHAGEGVDGESGWLCRVSYFAPDGTCTRQLREPHSPFPTDVFERAMAQLGAGGWELVALSHELVRNNASVASERFLGHRSHRLLILSVRRRLLQATHRAG
jgi:hypothetical protein